MMILHDWFRGLIRCYEILEALAERISGPRILPYVRQANPYDRLI